MADFGWEYPAGSMRGSGIYSSAEEGDYYCAECGEVVPGTFESDDWGRVTWHCDTHTDVWVEVDTEVEYDEF